MRRRGAAWLAPVLTLLAPAGALAQPVKVDVPAGSLGAAASELARQLGMNIVLVDAKLWDRPVPRIRGTMIAEVAVRRLAQGGGVQVQRRSDGTWRLSASRMRSPVRAAGRPPPSGSEEPGDIVIHATKRATPQRWATGGIERISVSPDGIDAGSAALVARSTVISSTYRGAGREKLFVRGIADSGFAGQLQSVTGVYLGEVRLGYSATDPDVQLHDIVSVEVLPGPQGTLYGAGALAGIIRMNPATPNRDEVAGTFGTGLSFTTGGSAALDVDAVANVPLADALALRLVGYARKQGGFIDKPALGRDVNRSRVAGGRAAVRWWTAPGWTVDAIVLAQNIRGRDSQYVSADAPPLTSLNPLPEPFDSGYRAAHLVVNGRIGTVSVTSVAAVARQSLSERFNALDGLNGGAIVDVGRGHRLQSYELRAAHEAGQGEGWVLGLALTDSDGRLDRRSRRADADRLDRVDYRVTEAALFGEGSVRLTSFLSVGAGARFSHVVSSADMPATSSPSFDDDRSPRHSERWLLPTASVTLFPASTLSAFVRYQEGRRPGALVVGQGAARERVAGDRLYAIEGGLRWQDAGHGTATASISRTRWRDVQADYFEEASGLFNGSLGNATIRSASVSFDWPVSNAARIDGAITLNDGRIVSPRGGEAIGPQVAESTVAAPAGGARIPGIADVIARLAARWSARAGNSAMARVEGWARYEGESVASIGPIVVGRQGDYVATGLSLALEHEQGTASLTLDNLLNARATRFLLGSAVFAGDRRPTPLRPFTARIGVRRTF